MKKILPFFLIVIVGLLFGCSIKNINENAKTCLVIQNQSSFSIKSIKYDGQLLVLKDAESFVLVDGSKGERGKKRTISIDENTMVYVPSDNIQTTLGELIE